MAVGRQFGREAFVYLLGFLGAGVIQFLAVPIYSRTLGPDQYGLLALTVALTSVLSGVMSLGGDVALARLWPEALTQQERRELASTWIVFLTAWSIVVAVVACLFAPALAGQLRPGTNFGAVLAVGVLGLIPTLLSTMLGQVLRNSFRPIPYAWTTVSITGACVAIGLLLAIGLDLGVYGIVLGTLLGQTFGCIVRLPLIRGSIGRPLKRPLLPPLLRLGVPLVPTSLAMWTFTGADRLVVAAHSSERQLGGYGLAAVLMGLFTLIVLSMGQAWIPRISALNEGDPAAARHSTSAAIGLALGGLGAIALLVGVLAPWLIVLVGGEEYADGAEALPFLALGATFAGASVFALAGLALAKRTVLISLVTVGAAVLDIGLLVILVPLWGLAGAALSVACAYFALAAGAVIAARRVLRLDVGLVRLTLVCLLLTAQATISTLAPASPGALFSFVVSVVLLGRFTLQSARVAMMPRFGLS